MNSNKTLVVVLLLLSLIFNCMVTEAQENHSSPAQCLVYIGTYTGPKSKGIYAYRMDLATGTLSPLGCVAETPNPTFLDLAPDGRFLYAADEINQYQGQPAGSVVAYSIDAATGKLTELNEVSSKGTGPCHILIDRNGKNALVANYAGGSAAVLPIKADGKVAEASFFQQYVGHSINAKRQEAAHAHCMVLDNANNFAFVCDLGSDKIMSYRFDSRHGKLIPNSPASLDVKPGTGPRHLAFSPNGKFAYLLSELSSTMTAFSYDSDHGTLKELQTIAMLPDDFKGQNTCAEIAVHPSGKFLYGSNRGHNSITVFAIDADKGTLAFVDRPSSGGKIPRGFGIEPTGKFLVAGNQDSSNLVVFAIDAETGKLKPTGQEIELTSPVCVKFLPSGSK